MTIKPVASSFDALSKPSPFANRPRASAQDEAPKPAQIFSSATGARPSPAADSRPTPVANYQKPVPSADVISATSSKPVKAADVSAPAAASDVAKPSATSAKPRVSVKA